jgi:hypothetical protein
LRARWRPASLVTISASPSRSIPQAPASVLAAGSITSLSQFDESSATSFDAAVELVHVEHKAAEHRRFQPGATQAGLYT